MRVPPLPHDHPPGAPPHNTAWALSFNICMGGYKHLDYNVFSYSKLRKKRRRKRRRQAVFLILRSADPRRCHVGLRRWFNDKTFASQAWGTEFNSQSLHNKPGMVACTSYPRGEVTGGRNRRIHEVHCTASLASLVKIQANETPWVKQKSVRCLCNNTQNCPLTSNTRMCMNTHIHTINRKWQEQNTS